MANIIITGAAGFVGSSLVDALVKDGHKVIGVDCLTDYYSKESKLQNLQLAMGHSNFEFRNEDLNHINLQELLADADVVFHQAAQPGVRKSWGKDFGEYIDQNIRATQKLLEAARDTQLQKFVYASSSSIYGQSDSYPVTENTIPRPNSPYGVTKLSAEQLCTLYAKNFGVPTVSLRYFTVYGPRQRPDMAFTRFITAALDDKEIEVFGTGDQIRDFTFIGDVVNANIAAGFQDIQPGSVFNVAGGSSVTLNHAISVIGQLTGGELKVIYRDTVAGDVFETGATTDLFREKTGWNPVVKLEEGLARQVDWLKGL